MPGYTDGVISHHGSLDPGTTLLRTPFTGNQLINKGREILDAPRSPAC